MSYLRSLLRRLFRRTVANRTVPTAAKTTLIEGLESRAMFSGSPALTGIHLTGSLRAVTGVVFTFDQPLDPTAASNIQGYQVGRLTPASGDGGGFDWTSLLGFLAQPKSPLVKNNKVQFTSATYDDPSQSVTLTPVRPFSALAWFRFIRVYGVGNNAIQDVSGNSLNGGKNTYVHWFPYVGRNFTYRDADNDLVHIGLRGPGQIVSFLQTNADHAPIIFVLNGNSRTVLTGRVEQSLIGDGIAIIPEVAGVANIQNTLTSNGQFDVRSTEP
ncbi:MAG TPA: hypothetical protein VLJ39_12615 [Tepidisphaeraceae bacterium]|nr:hypothetical protein [Tepidisphaeraceae bacterium]